MPHVNTPLGDSLHPVPILPKRPCLLSSLVTDAPNLARLLLTVREAAQALAISERSLWGLTHRGAIPCVRLGRAVRYDLADLQSFIVKQKRNGRPL